MKKLFLLGAMVCALGMMTAEAQRQTILVAPSLESENLKGPVRVVQTATVDIESNEEVFPWTKTMAFKKSGRLYYSAEKDPHFLIWEKFYSTNTNNQLTHICQPPLGVYEYHYNDGRLQYVSFLYSEHPEEGMDTLWVTEYNVDGLPSIIRCSKFDRYDFDYYPNGVLKKETQWRGLDLGAPSEIYFYNEHGQLDSIIWGWRCTTYSRDERGDVLKQAFGTIHGTNFDNELSVTTYRYLQYDNHGNWLLREITNSDGSIWREQRQIIYYE